MWVMIGPDSCSTVLGNPPVGAPSSARLAIDPIAFGRGSTISAFARCAAKEFVGSAQRARPRGGLVQPIVSLPLSCSADSTNAPIRVLYLRQSRRRAPTGADLCRAQGAATQSRSPGYWYGRYRPSQIASRADGTFRGRISRASFSISASRHWARTPLLDRQICVT